MKYPKKVKKLVIMGANLCPDKSAVKIAYIRMARRTKILLNILGIFNDKARHDKKLIKMLLKYPNIDHRELNKISIPTLVLAGDQDIIKEDHTKLIASSIPAAKFIIFPNSTHFIPQENPELFNKTVMKFLFNN